MSYKIAVVGATGNVGRAMLSVLSEKKFPVKEVVALASRESKGKSVSFGEEEILTVGALDEFDFTGTDIALFSPGANISKIYAPKAAKAGCIVIDNTSYFRMDNDVPLIVPEVNIKDLAGYKKKNIIANPNCAVIQTVVALAPLHKEAKIKRIVLSTYQSVSGAGKQAMDELYTQTKGIYTLQEVKPTKFGKRIAFNIIPQIGDIEENGYSSEEIKQINEIKKILDPNINVTATCVRVTVFVGHAVSVNVEFEEDLSAEEAVEILEEADGVSVMPIDRQDSYITPAEIVTDDFVHVSRIREDNSVKSGLNMWITADNLRKGAALNAVQIAEYLIKDYL